jgi:hypothetical protein
VIAQVDQMRPHIYQLFELVSRGSHNLGVFDFTFFLRGYYRILDGGHERSETNISHVSFD